MFKVNKYKNINNVSISKFRLENQGVNESGKGIMLEAKISNSESKLKVTFCSNCLNENIDAAKIFLSKLDDCLSESNPFHQLYILES